jgi:hypothetical protein
LSKFRPRVSARLLIASFESDPMQSIWDLLPASLWPTQPFIAPDEQARILRAFNNLQASRDGGLPLSAAGGPSNPPVVPSVGLQQAGPASTAYDNDGASVSAGWNVDPMPSTPAAPLRVVAAQPGANVATPSGILGAILGGETATKLPPTVSYGVTPKNAPPQPELPPPISAWQLPERDFSLNSPAAIERMIQTRAAGLNGVVLGDPGREHRDAARAADLLVPGSGNFVSGDWDNITASDVGNLLFSAAAAIPPFRIGSASARLAARAARVGAETESAAAARAAASRGEQAAAEVADTVEPTSSRPLGPPLTGQNHHAISKKVHDALEEVPGLAGIYRYRDPRFQTRAADETSHRGYQTWHRNLDREAAEYIRNNPMTKEQFENYIRDRYAQPDLLARFPNGL